jgi:hypothetical protein
MMKYISTFVLSVFLSGCATAYKPIPDGYVGPTALISDTKEREGSYKARFFVVAEIDGHKIENGISEARSASYGKGFMLEGGYAFRHIPARTMKVKLLGTHVTGAPIHEIFSRAAGTFFSVEGEIMFTPSPNGTYVVKGELKESGSTIWIEDTKTNSPVTEKIVATK